MGKKHSNAAVIVKRPLSLLLVFLMAFGVFAGPNTVAYAAEQAAPEDESILEDKAIATPTNAEAAPEMFSATPAEPDYAKLHIAMVYGNILDEEGEPADGVGGSHSFVEIYNPNDFPVELDEYYLFYQGFPTQFKELRNGWAGFDLPDDELAPHHSYLINCGENAEVTGALRLTDADFDATWTNAPGFVTKGAKYVIMYGVDSIDGDIINPFDIDGDGTKLDGYVDMFGGAGNDEDETDGQDGYETEYPINDGSSKQKGYVRIDRDVDTDNNADDFISVDFRNAQTGDTLPRSVNDGPLGGSEEPGHPFETSPWPGSDDVTTGNSNFKSDSSGLDFHDGRLYLIDNKSNMWVMDVAQDGTLSFANGWENGKRVQFQGAPAPDGEDGGPDSEGITVDGGGFVYLASERDNRDDNVNSNKLLRIAPDSAASYLAAQREWDLTSLLPDVNANYGIEAVEWVADANVDGKLFDENTGAAFDSGDYSGTVPGVFFVAMEYNGHVYAFVLKNDGTATRIADIDSGIGGAMALDYDTYEDTLWIAADNGYANVAARVEFNGTQTVDIDYFDPPAGVTVSRNNEGFAIADASYTVDGQRPVYRFADDVSSGALTIGGIDCDYENEPPADPEPDPEPDTYTVTVSGSYASSSGAGSYEAGQTVTVRAGSRTNYSFAGWTVTGATLPDRNSATTTFTMPANAVSVTAGWRYNSGSSNNDDDDSVSDSDSGGGGGGGSGGGASTTTATGSTGPSPVTAAAATAAATAAVEAARSSGSGTATANLRNAGEISLPALQAMANTAGDTPLALQADTLVGNAVDVRITLDPALATSSLNLSGSTQSAGAAAVSSLFERFHSNNVMTVALGQQGNFSQPVEVAAKLEAGLDTQTLVFYVYDPANNSYTRILSPAYWVDVNGYVHFTTQLAGYIVISDGELTRLG